MGNHQTRAKPVKVQPTTRSANQTGWVTGNLPANRAGGRLSSSSANQTTRGPLSSSAYQTTQGFLSSSAYQTTQGPLSSSAYQTTQGFLSSSAYQTTQGPLSSSAYQTTQRPFSSSANQTTKGPLSSSAYQTTQRPLSLLASDDKKYSAEKSESGLLCVNVFADMILQKLQSLETHYNSIDVIGVSTTVEDGPSEFHLKSVLKICGVPYHIQEEVERLIVEAYTREEVTNYVHRLYAQKP